MIAGAGQALLGLAAGTGMGMVLSVLGAGGSIFIVPVLVYGFSSPVTIATGTSLAVVSAGAAVGAWGHARRGNVQLKVALFWSATGMLGAIAGSELHRHVSDRLVLGLFAAILFIASARMVIGNPPNTGESRPASMSRVLPLGAALGVLTGFLGVGGGFLMVPALIWGARLSVRDAIGTSLIVIATTAATAAASYAVKGTLSLPLIAAVGGGAVLGALLGAPISGKLPEKPLRYSFAALAAGLGVYMLVRSVLKG